MSKDFFMNQSDEINYTSSGQSSEQIILELNTVLDDFRPVFITGNFNNWKGKDELFRMTFMEPGKYTFQFPEDFKFHQPLEYKYTREGWKGEEVDEFGSKTKNRIVEHPVGKIEDFVPRWAINGKGYKEKYLPKIHIISEAFEIPQLIKTRRITALLPHNYGKSKQRYPVLYLQDGQNLFDDNAPFGNWGVDKKLAVLTEKGMGDIIIIAIDHAREERVAEFTPSIHNRPKETAEGKKYVRFLADTLKPFIDKTFRTKPEVEFTGIGGSSMGGLISIYAGFMYPEVYSKLMIFSPSLWMTSKIHFHSIHLLQVFDTRIYLYAGGKESNTMIPNLEGFKKLIQQKKQQDSHFEFLTSIDPDGTHNETRWGIEFPKAIKWLFFN